MWKCKECGGEVILKEDNIYEDIYVVEKNGNKGKRISSQGPFLNEGWRYECQLCGKGTEEYYDNEICEIAYWVEE